MKTRFADVTPYVTKDGSALRELMHPDVHGNRAQSLAEAVVAAGARTLPHRPRAKPTAPARNRGGFGVPGRDLQLVNLAVLAAQIAHERAILQRLAGDAPLVHEQPGLGVDAAAEA